MTQPGDSYGGSGSGGFRLRSQDREGATPSAPRPTIDQVKPLIRTYYEKDGNGAGGSLHMVLDDGNIETQDILFCLKWAKDRGDADGIQIAELLLPMTRRQRAKAVGR